MIDFPAGPSTNGAVVTMDGANATTMTANGSLGGHQKWYADFDIAQYLNGNASDMTRATIAKATTAPQMAAEPR